MVSPVRLTADEDGPDVPVVAACDVPVETACEDEPAPAFVITVVVACWLPPAVCVVGAVVLVPVAIPWLSLPALGGIVLVKLVPLRKVMVDGTLTPLVAGGPAVGTPTAPPAEGDARGCTFTAPWPDEVTRAPIPCDSVPGLLLRDAIVGVLGREGTPACVLGRFFFPPLLPLFLFLLVNVPTEAKDSQELDAEFVKPTDACTISFQSIPAGKA